MAVTMEPIPGIAFDFGGSKIYTLAPLTLGALERLQDGLQALATDAALAPTSVKTVVSVAHASLLRNYPTLTRDDVLELLDVGNMADVADAVMDVSGLRRKALEEAKNQAAQPAQALTGLPPLPTFVPTPAGPGATSAITATFPP